MEFAFKVPVHVCLDSAVHLAQLDLLRQQPPALETVPTLEFVRLASVTVRLVELESTAQFMSKTPARWIVLETGSAHLVGAGANLATVALRAKLNLHALLNAWKMEFVPMAPASVWMVGLAPTAMFRATPLLLFLL